MSTLFRTQSGQTGKSAYVYELAAIANEYRELNARLAKLTEAMAAELPADVTGTQSIATERFPDASMPVDAATYRRQLAMFPVVDRTALDMLSEMIDGMDDFKPVEPIIRTADDFCAAAAELKAAGAPDYVVADVREESDYLATVDPAEIGSPAVVSRYLATSRASRRRKVNDWLLATGRKPNGVYRDALELIGGQGS